MIEKYICRACSKTFYNANALQNHKNLQHDKEDSSSDGENALITTPLMFTDHVRSREPLCTKVFKMPVFICIH